MNLINIWLWPACGSRFFFHKLWRPARQSKEVKSLGCKKSFFKKRERERGYIKMDAVLVLTLDSWFSAEQLCPSVPSLSHFCSSSCYETSLSRQLLKNPAMPLMGCPFRRGQETQMIEWQKCLISLTCLLLNTKCGFSLPLCQRTVTATPHQL